MMGARRSVFQPARFRRNFKPIVGLAWLNRLNAACLLITTFCGPWQERSQARSSGTGRRTPVARGFRFLMAVQGTGERSDSDRDGTEMIDTY
jgi:hypothetical protein